MQEWNSLSRNECDIIIARHMKSRERVLNIMKRTRNFKRVNTLVLLNTLFAQDIMSLLRAEKGKREE